MKEGNVKKDKIKNLISNLPSLIPDFNEERINQISEEIFLIFWLAQSNEAPHAIEASIKSTITELQKFEKLAVNLAKHIQTMRKPARIILEENSAKPNISSYFLAETLRQQILLSNKARKKLLEASTTSNDQIKQRRPKKIAAEWVTEYLFEIYEVLTGEKPKRNSKDGYEQGEFFEFVKSVFAILEINASADAQIRRVYASEKNKSKTA